MLTHWRVEFDPIHYGECGTFALVEAPSLLQSLRVRAYYQELRNAIARWQELGRSLYPWRADDSLYFDLAPYYKQVARELNAPDPDKLAPHSRYLMFVATEPADNELGFSGIEQLLGLTRVTKEEPSDEVFLTTGDRPLDVAVDVMLMFPHQGLDLMNCFSMAQLSLMVAQACDRSRGQEALDELQQERDRVLFEQNESTIAQEFSSMGFPLNF